MYKHKELRFESLFIPVPDEGMIFTLRPLDLRAIGILHPLDRWKCRLLFFTTWSVRTKLNLQVIPLAKLTNSVASVPERNIPTERPFSGTLSRESYWPTVRLMISGGNKLSGRCGKINNKVFIVLNFVDISGGNGGIWDTLMRCPLTPLWSHNQWPLSESSRWNIKSNKYCNVKKHSIWVFQGIYSQNTRP
jgi:hypothetical protein